MGTSLVVLIVGTFVMLVACIAFTTLVVLVVMGRICNRPVFVLLTVVMFAAAVSNLIAVLGIVRDSS